jgi:hypothetical protein
MSFRSAIYHRETWLSCMRLPLGINCSLQTNGVGEFDDSLQLLTDISKNPISSATYTFYGTGDVL